ncbi:hypothetical protein TNCV_4419941 [Trichonephila clavipes]|nr:hypothetical protein TNCV_4419941 [Trichonephila clavipes]
MQYDLARFHPNFQGGGQWPPTSLPLPPTKREDLRLDGYLEHAFVAWVCSKQPSICKSSREDGKRRRETPDHPQATANDRRHLALCHDEFRGLCSDLCRSGGISNNNNKTLMFICYEQSPDNARSVRSLNVPVAHA